MDALKNFGNKGQEMTSNQTTSAPAAGQKDDYGDKGMSPSFPLSLVYPPPFSPCPVSANTLLRLGFKCAGS
ncbi:hypothetical protein RRF57_012474 [Xylaria bambusicola]|uniref:Uncharacterized protein n=1 Tax=Xylaria bambusicola TaxID=326684 RepID=A0AAN7UV90_9PEZI